MYIKCDSDIDNYFNEDPMERGMIARATKDPQVLAMYAYDPSFLVRRCVASNRNILPETLEALIDDPDIGILIYVASNPNATAEILNKVADRFDLADPHNGDMLVGLAGNKHSSPELLARLSANARTQVRKYVAANPNTSDDVLYRLASSDPSAVVRSFANMQLDQRGIELGEDSQTL